MGGVGSGSDSRAPREGGMAITSQGRLIARLCLALVVAALALTIGADGVRATYPGVNGRIAVFSEVFTWQTGGAPPVRPPLDPDLLFARVETYRPDGRGRRVLYTFPGGESFHYGGTNELAWSPSGKLLAFEEGSRLAVMRDDGTRLRALPQLTWEDAEPTWSPNGRRLAFTGHNECSLPYSFRLCSALYTVRSDGTGLHRIADRAASALAWSPTGTLAFLSSEGRLGLYAMSADGSRRRLRLRRRLAGTYELDWSPDGSKIAFEAGGHIYRARADGRGLRQLTDPESSNSSSPAWSPDGRYIAFIRDERSVRDGSDVYVMRSNGRGVRRIVDVAEETSEMPYRVLSSLAWQSLPATAR
jgi:dipeptidyl aminopeptidase/acylaminoacyl peptidase